MGPDVTLVSSDTETAKDVYRELVSAGLERRSDAPPVIRYEATGGSASDFETLAHRMLGSGVTHVELVETGAISLPTGRGTERPTRRPPTEPHPPRPS
ncbi:hypothetical protein BC477_18065 [Clavibacter michiganensis subsp. michiganensis]|uniref:Uncharacterized protein n=1 Tax=Clavibacter michiganensis subsp. michiganensis TaxID=33013 RepID=A0A251XGR0_CLAMM|nr:hypothetical protein BC477_18065 [Clavibacter michiganensis subsp. michiganensis]OUE01387.1 hypothetical protein CMMCAS07_13850 [Clavibacter michiganensis subsp. michiganensis]